MQEVKILLENIERVKKFVAITSQYDADFDLIIGRYIIDAKSILGILSIDLSKPVGLRFYVEEDEAEEILEGLKEYIVG